MCRMPVLAQAAARVSLEVTPGPVLQAAQQEQEARFARLQPRMADAAHQSSSDSAEADERAGHLARLRDNMRAALRCGRLLQISSVSILHAGAGNSYR